MTSFTIVFTFSISSSDTLIRLRVVFTASALSSARPPISPYRLCQKQREEAYACSCDIERCRPLRRQVPQRIPEEEKQQARRSCEKNLPARDALGAHAARTPAAQSQKSRSEEFGQVRVSEKPRRTLDVPQQTVRCAERAAVRIEPSVVFIRTNRFIQFLKPTTSVLFRTLC